MSVSRSELLLMNGIDNIAYQPIIGSIISEPFTVKKTNPSNSSYPQSSAMINKKIKYIIINKAFGGGKLHKLLSVKTT
jgi:hypothetical protein